MNYNPAFSLTSIVALTLCTVLFLPACQDKKTCYYSCYEKSLKGYEDGNCGTVIDSTRKQCHAFVCNSGDPGPRTSWGVEPSWCKKKPAVKKSTARLRALHMRHASSYVGPITKASKQDARKLVAASIAKKGGMDKLKAIKTIKSTSVMRGMVNASITVVTQLPDRYRAEVFRGKKHLRTVVWRGKQTFLIVKGSVSELKGAQLTHTRRATAGDSLPLLLAASKPDAKLSYLGTAFVMGKPAHALKIVLEPGPFELTFYLDVASYDLVATQFFSGLHFMTIVESNFKAVNGVRFAHSTKMLIGVQPADATLQTLELNPSVDPSIFTKLTR